MFELSLVCSVDKASYTNSVVRRLLLVVAFLESRRLVGSIQFWTGLNDTDAKNQASQARSND